MCIDAPKSTTNFLSSSFNVDAGRHLFSGDEKNAALSCIFNLNTFWPVSKLLRGHLTLDTLSLLLNETSVAPALPCKIMKNCGSGGSDKNTTKLACILEANESTRMRMGYSQPHNHEDHIAGKGENSLQKYNLVHKFIPIPQGMKIPAAKGGGQRMGKIGENFGVELDESQK